MQLARARAFTHARMHTHTHTNTRARGVCVWHACVRVHSHTRARACIDTCIHTCTAATGNFSATWHTRTTTATHSHEHACTYTVRHSMKDLRHAVDPAVRFRGRTPTLHVIITIISKAQILRIWWEAGELVNVHVQKSNKAEGKRIHCVCLSVCLSLTHTHARTTHISNRTGLS